MNQRIEARALCPGTTRPSLKRNMILPPIILPSLHGHLPGGIGRIISGRIMQTRIRGIRGSRRRALRPSTPRPSRKRNMILPPIILPSLRDHHSGGIGRIMSGRIMQPRIR